MTGVLPPPGALGRVARLGAWGALIYWGIYAAVAPVTTIDSQMYNLTRIELALRGGLFNNDYFTSVFHVIFPWSFDAVHLPFLQLGWGYALPSYLCLVGTCCVVFTMIRDRFGVDAAWVGVVSLLALTCLVYQGTSTKNDIPVLFAGAVWVYARWQWRREAKGVQIMWMVLALGFMAGAKTAGALYAALLAGWTLWELRARRELAGRAAAGLIGAWLLFGSVETYVETTRLYGHPLGPRGLLHRMGNHDGVRGGLANLTRHVAGSIYVGPTNFREGQAVARLNEAERKLLAWTGLTNAGAEVRFPDSTLFLSQSGLEELSGFGPVGTMAMATLLFAGLCWRPKAVWWRLAAAAFLGVVLVSLTVAYTCWTNRYLISWYALGAVAFVCALWETDSLRSHIIRWSYLAVVLAGVIAAPWFSFNRDPPAILASWRDRDRLETSSYPVNGAVRERLRKLKEASPRSQVFLVVHDESVVLPLLEDRNLAVIMVTGPVFLRLAANGRLATGDLVVLENRTNTPVLALVEEVTAPDVFSDGQTRTEYLYRVIGPSNKARAPASRPRFGAATFPAAFGMGNRLAPEGTAAHTCGQSCE